MTETDILQVAFGTGKDHSNLTAVQAFSGPSLGARYSEQVPEPLGHRKAAEIHKTGMAPESCFLVEDPASFDPIVLRGKIELILNGRTSGDELGVMCIYAVARPPLTRAGGTLNHLALLIRHQRTPLVLPRGKHITVHRVQMEQEQLAAKVQLGMG